MQASFTKVDANCESCIASLYSRTWFEWSPAIYSHFFISGPIFHVNFMVKLSNEVLGHFSGNFCSHSHTQQTPNLSFVLLFPRLIPQSELRIPGEEGRIVVSICRYDTPHLKSHQVNLLWSLFEVFWKMHASDTSQWRRRYSYSIFYLKVRELVNKEGKNAGIHIWLEIIFI